jgi:uncharacterized membrane protein YjjP (DUF1212 family)
MGRTGAVMEVCLLAGEIMLKYGAETYRVEETMERMARSQDMFEVHSFVTPTGIFLSFKTPEHDMERTRVVRINDRLVDLNKVTMVNDLSRRLVETQLTLLEARQELSSIDRQPMNTSISMQHFAAGMAGGSFAILFGGGLIDFIPAFFAGLLVNVSQLLFQRVLKVKFFAELVSAFIGGVAAISFFYFGLGENLDPVIIGAMMPLVPGLPLTNAVRDIMAGDLLAGVGRGADATLTALSIATGIAIAISIFL